MTEQFIQSIKKKASHFRMAAYHYWLKKNEHFSSPAECEKVTENWTLKPVFSILLPVYKTDLSDLNACVQSVLDQVYPHWELCIVNDHSEDPVLDQWLKQMADRDKRICYTCRSENGHIARASNDALAMASGSYIALLDHDDVLSPYALYKAAEVINAHPESDFIYSNEDKLTPSGQRCQPFFKPDWSPDLLLSQNYICHLAVIRTSLVKQVGGFEPGLDGAQDYDLFLKCTEQTDKILHIPELLYHWRMTEQSTAENPEAKAYAFSAGKRALEKALERRGISATVQQKQASPGDYHITYAVSGSPKVSIIIHPDKSFGNPDAHSGSEKLKAMMDRSGYDHWEIIHPGTIETALFNKMPNTPLYDHVMSAMPMAEDMTIAHWLNQAINKADGEMILLLNDHVLIQSENWLAEMVGLAQQSHIGAVSPVIFYPDETIRHAGIALDHRDGIRHPFNRHLPIKIGGLRRATVTSDVSALSADALMFSRKAFRLVGGFDHQHFTECLFDVDFCMQLRQSGFYAVCTGELQGHYSGPKHVFWKNDFNHLKTVQQEIKQFKEKWKNQLDYDPYYQYQ